ncbi:hypothetical protein I7I48_05271 [Histoplasma ohiense]|nr:hypothetical protein I7I48_05271 [Histoplasma ohiense (nom. inval.)]
MVREKMSYALLIPHMNPVINGRAGKGWFGCSTLKDNLSHSPCRNQTSDGKDKGIWLSICRFALRNHAAAIDRRGI